MRRFAFIAPLAAVMAVAATPARAQPEIIVILGPKVQADAERLGEREVGRQVSRLAEVVGTALARSERDQYVSVRLTLVDLKPNRPTFEQVARTPGLSAIDSLSIGGAEVQIDVIGIDGEHASGSVDYFSHSLADVRGLSTWQDADRAYARVAARLAHGRI